MTDPKKPTPSGASSRSKASEQPSPTTDLAGDPLGKLLEQLGKIADSVGRLTEPRTEATTETGPAAEERRKALFAYEFLGEVLGRTNFAVPRVGVTRCRAATGSTRGALRFTELLTGTKARVRAADNSQEVLRNLQEGVVSDEMKVIKDDQPIDSIVVLDITDVPVAIGPCVPVATEPCPERDHGPS